MRSKVIVILTAVCLVAVGVYAALVDQGDNGVEVHYTQHEQAQQISDLSRDDQQAVNSYSTDADSFASHLPVVSIETGGQEIPGDIVYEEDGSNLLRPDGRYYTTKAADGTDDITVSVKIYDNENGANRLSDEPTIETKSLIHYRGHRSRDFPKRNFSLHFIDEDGSNRSESVMGMPSENGWIINGPYLDKSLVRNYLAYNVFGEFTDNAPEVRFCELFLDGEYRGLFLFMEAIDVSDNRIKLTEPTNTLNRGSATSYLLKLDRYDMEATTLNNFSSYTGLLDSSLTIEYPGDTELTQDQVEYICDDFSEFEKALYSYDYDTASYGYWNYVDVESFVSYFIANEFSMNYDAGLYSTYLYKDVRGLITLGPIWDFNSAFDNYVEADYEDASGFVMVNRPWFTMMVKDENFTGQAIALYRELREGPLSEDRLLSFIDGTLAYLGPAIDRNWEVWGSVFDPETIKPEHRLIPIERNPESYEEAVDDLKSFIVRRGVWLDEHIENLGQYSHESAVKMDNH